MKKILFLIMAAIAIAGCSRNNEDLPTSSISVDLIKLLAQDSIHGYYTNNYENVATLVKCKRANQEIVWEKEIIIPNPIKVDLGYGEQAEYKFTLDRIGFEIDTKDLIFIVLWAGEYHERSALGIYTIDGEFVSNITLNPSKNYDRIWCTGSTRWINGSTIFTYNNYNNNGESLFGYIIIDKNGKTIDSKEGVELMSTKDPQYCWSRGYVFNREKTVYICNFDFGTKEIYISDIVKNMYPEEVNPPKINIKSLSGQDDIITISTELTFYDGSKKEINIGVNINTFEIVS